MFDMKRLIISFLVLSFVLTQLVSATDFSINVDLKEFYFAAKTDYIILKINNDLSYEDWFTISVIGVPQEWVIPETSLKRIPAYGSEEIKIEVKLGRDAMPNVYSYFLKVTRVSTKSEIEKEMLINIRQITSAIIKDLSISCETCLDEVSVSGMVHNVGSRTLDLALIAKVANQQKTISIGKLDIFEKKPFETTFSLEGTNPGNYLIELNLVDAVGNSLYTDSIGFKIPSIENIIYDRQDSPTPFGNIITLTATNKGNIVSDIELKGDEPEWYSAFSGPAPTGMIVGKYFWKRSLAPDESISVTYSEIYWPTYVLIIIAILIGVFIHWQSMALVLTKNVIRGKRFGVGGEVSVSLSLKNKKKELKRVAIRDVVPSNFSIVSKFETVKPIIRKIASGIELIWKIGDLKPHEERVLHYTIKPTVEEIPRRTSLPSAIMKALRGNNLLIKRSNRVSLTPEEEEKRVVTVKVSK